MSSENSEGIYDHKLKKQFVSQMNPNFPINLVVPSNNKNNINVNVNYGIIEHQEKTNIFSNQESINSASEAENLIQRWKAGNFVDFNRWIQISKAECKVEFSMKPGLGGMKNFICNMALNFNKNIQNNNFFSSGFGKSKKEAKSRATENMLRDLIQKNCFRLGVRGDHLQNSSPNSEGNIALQDFKKNYLSRKIRGLNYEMQEFLCQDKFQDACEVFQRLCMMKVIEWKDVFIRICYLLYIS